jgi:hypothetical protein
MARKITDIGKPEMIALRTDIEEALAALGESLGLKFRTGSGTYNGANAHFKLEIEVADAAIQGAKDREEFMRWCDSFGLRPEDHGTEFKNGIKRYRVVGIELKRRKFPIKVLSLDEGDKPVLFGLIATDKIRAATDSKLVADAKAKAAA